MKWLWGAALALAMAGSAQAATAVDENFDSLASGFYAAGSLGPNLTIFSGSVDLFASGGFGLTCHGGGKCIDLDGSGSAATLIETKAFALNTGDVVSFSLGYEGSQRGDTNSLSAGLVFSNYFDFTDVTFNGNFVGDVSSDSLRQTLSVASDKGYTVFNVTAKVASGSGQVVGRFSTPSRDSFGPLIDNVKLEITGTSVPEPSAWALMIMGFGAAGAGLRRRRSALAA